MYNLFYTCACCKHTLVHKSLSLSLSHTTQASMYESLSLFHTHTHIHSGLHVRVSFFLTLTHIYTFRPPVVLCAHVLVALTQRSCSCLQPTHLKNLGYPTRYIYTYYIYILCLHATLVCQYALRPVISSTVAGAHMNNS